MIDLSNYNIYTNKDGRMRAYNKTTHAVTSYPRLLMELTLGKPLLKTEDVHHKDENPLNNNIDNLEVIDYREHERKHAQKHNKKYKNEKRICPICKTIFIWTSKQQYDFYSHFKSNKNNSGPFCSRRCAGINGQRIQMKKHNKESIFLIDGLKRICPICGKEFVQSKTSQSRYNNGKNKFSEPVCSSKCRHEYRRRLNIKKEIA